MSGRVFFLTTPFKRIDTAFRRADMGNFFFKTKFKRATRGLSVSTRDLGELTREFYFLKTKFKRATRGLGESTRDLGELTREIIFLL